MCTTSSYGALYRALVCSNKRPLLMAVFIVFDHFLLSSTVCVCVLVCMYWCACVQANFGFFIMAMSIIRKHEKKGSDKSWFVKYR